MNASRMPRFAVMLVFFACFAFACGTARAAEKLKVIVHERDNLEYLAFWAAKAGGSFAREGIDLEIVVAPKPAKGSARFDGPLTSGEVDAAIASPPVYFPLIAARAPVIVIANLSANDPYALVARPSVVAERKISESSSVHDRLTALKGATILVPPPAWGRLRSLLASQQLDLGKDVKGSVLLSKEQRAVFGSPTTDGAYLASPLLEKSVASGEAVVVVNQARAEVPELASPQSNVMLVSAKLWKERRDVATAAVRAIADAETRIHTHQAEVVDALARELPERDKRELETIVRLYEPGVPKTPDVHVEGFERALALIPAAIPKPALTGIDLAAYVAPAAPQTAGAKPASSGSSRWLPIALGVLVLGGIIFIIRRRRNA